MIPGVTMFHQRVIFYTACDINPSREYFKARKCLPLDLCLKKEQLERDGFSKIK